MLFRKSTESVGRDAGWSSGLLGSTRASSGQLVTAQTAMSVPMLQNCVSLLAESVAQLPLELYRSTKDGGRESASSHPLYDILKHSPNGWQSSFEYREMSQMSAGLRGNSFSYIERDNRGRVKALYPLDPTKVTVLKGPDLMPYYRVEGQTPMAQRMIHHVRWLSLDGYLGISPIINHANTIGYALALSEYSAKSFLHGTALSGVLERPKEAAKLTSQSMVDDLANAWLSKYGGSSNAAKVAVLQEGMTFKPLASSNVDAELIGALKLSDSDIARVFKIPLPMVGSMEGATYNNVEAMQTNFVIYALLPWLKRHEQAMMRDLLNPGERAGLTIEFNVSGLMRGSQQARYASYAVGRQWGWLSINDIRALENLEKIAGGHAYLQPLNMVDVTNPGASKPDNKVVDEVANALK